MVQLGAPMVCREVCRYALSPLICDSCMPYSAMNSNPGAGGFNATVVVEADCGIFALIQTTEELQSLYWRIDDALIFSPWIRTHADAAAARLRNMSRARGVADGRFNALHIRAEKDWVEHCNSGLGGHYPHCMRNTDQLHRVLAIEGVEEGPPLYMVRTMHPRPPCPSRRSLMQTHRSLNANQPSSHLL